LAIYKGHTAKVNCVAFAPDLTRVLTGSEDGTARLWDAASGQELAIFGNHDGAVTNVAFSPDGHMIITCDQHRHLFLWQIDGTGVGKLLGMYVTAYEIGAVQWQSLSSLLLADKGGLQYYPNFYRLKLEVYGR
jgi:WD40 repeat protein